jgi:hypothetical protein
MVGYGKESFGWGEFLIQIITDKKAIFRINMNFRKAT